MMICQCGCGNHLTGKQRRYYSDACRKRHQRSQQAGHSEVRELAENNGPASCKADLDLFPDKTSAN